MEGATQNIYVGLHEFPDMMLLLHFLRKGDLFLDVGANIGSFTVLASGVCGAETWAFEPDPDTLRHLKQNIAVNGLDALVKVYQCALGAEQGEVAFTFGLDSINRIACANDRNVRMTRLERLDNVIGCSDPIMIKLDVEGAEQAVLEGANALLANPSLNVVELETLTPESADILKGNEFARAFYDPFRHKLSREPIGLKSSNALFVRDWSLVADRLAGARKIEIFGREI
jgi:FkbM family methyltransferase